VDNGSHVAAGNDVAAENGAKQNSQTYHYEHGDLSNIAARRWTYL
jgi:hypothetical protein